MTARIDRRAFLKRNLCAGMAAAAGPRQASLPTVRLGNLEVSRLILGSNPFYGFAHQSGGLGEEMKSYYTDERIVATLDEAASHGITAVASPVYERWLRIFAKYRERGGKLRHWIAQPDGYSHLGGVDNEIDAALKAGAGAIFIQGERADELAARGDFDRLLKWVEKIKAGGIPAGMASHRPDVHLEAEKRKFPTDFYFQCFYNPRRGYREEDREKAVQAIAQIEKPVVGYKILAAGRLKGKEGFEFAFSRLRRKDAVCVGMFPKHQPDQIKENAGLARSLTKD